MTILWLPDDCLMTAWWLPDDCLTAFDFWVNDRRRKTTGVCLLASWWLPDDCLMTAWWMPDECLMNAWWMLDDNLMKLNSPLKTILFICSLWIVPQYFTATSGTVARWLIVTDCCVHRSDVSWSIQFKNFTFSSTASIFPPMKTQWVLQVCNNVCIC